MNHRTSFFLALALSALALTGCGRRNRQAAQPAQTTVVTTGGAQTVSVSHRHYRNLQRTAGRDMRCNPDQLAPEEVSPGIFSVSGCGQLREYVMVCGRRNRCRWTGIEPVEQVAMSETGCRTDQIVVQVPSALARRVTLCGQSVDYGLACGDGTCAWMRGAAQNAFMMQSEAGTSVVVVPDTSSSQVTVQEAYPADDRDDVVQIDAAGTLQTLLASQLAAMRSCTQGQSVELHVRWSDSGAVSVNLAAPYAGSAVEQCVQQAFGNLVVSGVSAGGELRFSL